jgi:hypothetical protein
VLATIQMSLIYRYMFGGAIHVAGTAYVDFLVPRFIATGVLFSGIGNVTAGDVLDAASVQAAVEGCDALINAAAVFSLDPGEAETMLATNAAQRRSSSKRQLEPGSIRSSTCPATSPFCQALRCSDQTVQSVSGHPPTRDRKRSLS